MGIVVPWFGDLGFMYACRLGVGALRRLFYALDVGASGAIFTIYRYYGGDVGITPNKDRSREAQPLNHPHTPSR